jgi:4-alpha-glucanotransferase
LRDTFNFAGMRILEFEFTDGDIQNRLGIRKSATPSAELSLESLRINARSPSPFPMCSLSQHESLFPENRIVYTATHDNDTIVGWWQSLSEDEKRGIWRFITQESPTKGYSNLHWYFCNHALSTNAASVILPLQDVLGLDRSARMNVPGQGEGNWGWRLKPGLLESRSGQLIASSLRRLTILHGRLRGPRLWLDPTVITPSDRSEKVHVLEKVSPIDKSPKSPRSP